MSAKSGNFLLQGSLRVGRGNIVLGSSRSARLDIKGPSPGFGAGVIHLLCAPLRGLCLDRNEAASLLRINRDSMVACVVLGVVLTP